MGTIATTIKRKDLYVEAARGGGVERRRLEEERRRGEWRSVRKLVREKWRCRCGAVRASVCVSVFVCGAPECVRLETFKHSLCLCVYVPKAWMCVCVGMCVCVSLQTERED